jgi:hypothetical protein
LGDLNLKSVLNDYKEKLCNKIFRYELNGKLFVNVRFYVESFCHLAGLHYVYENDKRYLGAKHYETSTRRANMLIKINYRPRNKKANRVRIDFSFQF